MQWAWRASRPATCAEDLHERNTEQQRSAGNYLYYTVSGLMYPGTQRLYRKPLTGGAPAAVLNGVTDVRRNAQQGGAHMLGTTATGLVRIAQPDDASPGTSTHPLAGLRQALALQPVIIGPDRSTSTRQLGRRRYEVTDHLGNVRVVLGDRKLSDFDPQNTPIPTHFSAEVMAYADYDPFGSLLPGRYADATSATYRFAFQGQESDKEIAGERNSYAFEYRMHDPRIGRMLSIDPLSSQYPFYSPYSFSGNRVVDMVEFEGLEPRTGRNKTTTLEPWRVELQRGLRHRAETAVRNDPHARPITPEQFRLWSEQRERNREQFGETVIQVENARRELERTGATSTRDLRVAEQRKSWQSVSAQEVIDRIGGTNPIVQTTSSGKTTYQNRETGLQVVYDNQYRYFRVQNPSASGTGEFLDQYGKPIPNNVPLLGPVRTTQTGVPRDVREKLTHFNDAD